MTNSANAHDVDPTTDLDGDPSEPIEIQFLSSLLFARGPVVRRTVEHLVPEDFYSPVNAELFTVIRDLIAAGSPHDSPMVLNALTRQGKAHGHAGERLVQALTIATVAGAPDTAVEAYGAALMSQAYRRSFHAAAQRLATIAAEAPEDELFERMCVLGREQRTATDRLNAFYRTDTA